jgi:hypothetical protein
MKSFFKKNIRYFIVGAVFIVVIVYSGFIPRVEEIEGNKDLFGEDLEEVRKADLDKNNLSKIYSNILNSKKDDFYRLVFKGESLEDEKILVSIISQTGNKKEIGEIELLKEDDEKTFELIFDTDDYFRDVIFERARDDDSAQEMIGDNWDDNEIYLSQINISRLNVDSLEEAQNLEKTILGNAAEETIYLLSKEKNYDLSKSKKNFCRPFNFSGGILSSVIINFSQVGNGGAGEYKLEIRDPGEGNNVIGKLIEKKRFEVKDLAEKSDDDNYKFDFPLKLEEEKKYFICINNERVEVDEDNFLRVNYIKGEKTPDDSMIGLEIKKPFIADDKYLSNNAKIEDLGEYGIYEYKKSGKEIDILDIYEQQGDVEFDEKSGIIMNKMKEGNYLTYKIDTIYPFQDLRLEIEKMKDNKGHVKLEYSFDNKNWIEIMPENEEDLENFRKEFMDYNLAIKNDDEDNTELYVRASCLESFKSKKSVFGLENLEITARLEK